jgi:hypothetical protein
MSTSREPATAPAGVSFEVDRFAWVDGRLEITGRWYGIRGRRFLRPTLDVEVDGSPRRMLAVLEHKPWAADDGEEWVAAFEWNGEPVPLAVAELAVAPELAVVLPPPTGGPTKRGRRPKATGERLSAAPPRARALEAELTQARAEAAMLRDRIAAEQKAWQKRVEEVEAQRDEGAEAKAAAEAERDEVAAARDKALAERDKALAERDSVVSGRDEATKARDSAVAERAAALASTAKLTGERDKALREKAALEEELAAAKRARDKARQERNEWLTRARDAVARQGPTANEALGAERRPPSRDAPAEDPDAPPHDPATAPLPRGGRLAPAPPPPNRPTKSQIPPGGILLPPTGPGSHQRHTILPGWAPRVLIPVVLVILAVVIALLVGWAT